MFKQKLISWFSVFTSVSTLVCCALPAAMVAFGFGAALIGLFTEVPQLIWLSEQKLWIFSLGAVMLAFGGYLQWQARHLPCPVDPVLAKACDQTRRTSLNIYLIALVIYGIGFSFSFIVPKFI